MRISTKCSIALHILVLIGVFEDRKLTSEIMALSTGCNPVIIRNLLGRLKKAGFIEVHRGTGGAKLIVDPQSITIYDVYQAVDETAANHLIALHPNPYQHCPVGKVIYDLLETPYQAITEATNEAMQSYSLQWLIDDYFIRHEKETAAE